MSTEAFTGRWNYPTSIRFGPGSVEALPDACRELGIRRPLIVTDSGLARLPIPGDIQARLDAAGLPAGIYSEVRGNPVGENVTGGVLAFQAGNHDGVVALGGGSALDVGKAVALMVGQERPLWDFEDVGDNWTRVDEAGMAPCVAVPTTAGTGSEVGRSSVIVRLGDDGAHRKVIIFHPRMMPGRVIADPELTVGLPPDLTTWTGLDALSHNLEAYSAPGFHPQADGIAAEGMRLIFGALEAAVADGRDIAARSRMLAASLMGATAFQKGLGAMHAVAHPVGARFDTHHGLTNAVVMPYVLQLNRAFIEDRIERLSAWLDLPGAFGAFLDRVLALREATGVPSTLRDLGVGLDAVDELAPLVVMDPTAGTNPRPLDVDVARQLLVRCIEGDLSGW